MIPDEQKSLLIQYWWKKSQDSLASANREYEAGSYSFAINRLYYSVFYAVSAALLKEGQSFKKHSGVRSAFHRSFIKSNKLDVKYGKFYDQLFEDRQEGDYVAFITFEEEYVQHQLKQCSEFLNRLNEIASVFKDD